MPGGVEDRLERHHHLHRRAVRVGDDPAVRVERLGVDLGHDQRHVVVHPPAATSCRPPRRPPRRTAAPTPRCAPRRPRRARGRSPGSTRRRAPARRARGRREVDLLPGRALGGERHDLVGREAALAHDVEDRGADGAGGARPRRRASGHHRPVVRRRVLAADGVLAELERGVQLAHRARPRRPRARRRRS